MQKFCFKTRVRYRFIEMKKPLLQIHTKYFINVLNFLKFLFNCNFQKRPFSASIMSLLKLFQITFHAQNREINKGENLMYVIFSWIFQTFSISILRNKRNPNALFNETCWSFSSPEAL